MTGKIKKLLPALVALGLAAIFFNLGMWQLDRAQELSASENNTVIQDQRIYDLSELTSAEGSLPVASFLKSVSASGYYIANYRAPNQVDANGVIADWEVALLQTDPDSAILVVRGLWADRLTSPEIVMSTKVSITGVIAPAQFEDRAANTSSQLARIDSSLLTALVDYQLYDGFISASSESYQLGNDVAEGLTEEVERTRITVALPKGDIPGYYWQHISYVAIWWFMAILVLWAPFYKRRDTLSA